MAERLYLTDYGLTDAEELAVQVRVETFLRGLVHDLPPGIDVQVYIRPHQDSYVLHTQAMGKT